MKRVLRLLVLPDNILSQHSVDHNDHGTDKFESSAEKQKVRSGPGHNDNGQTILGIAETEKSAVNSF